MTDIFSAWMQLPLRLLTMQQAYFKAVTDAAEAGQKMMTAMQANQIAAEAGTRALGSWTSLVNQAA